MNLADLLEYTRKHVLRDMAKVAQFNTSTALEADVKNQMSNLTLIEDKLKALLAEAQALAQMSTSLINNVHVSAGVSGGRNVSVNYSYSNDTSGLLQLLLT